MTLENQHVVVLGLGVSGRSAVRFLKTKKAKVIPLDDQSSAGGSAKKGYDGPFDLLVVSPGISPCHPFYQKAMSMQCPVIGEAELGLRHLRSPVIGITGTNGKTTVTSMTAHVLAQSGIPAKAVGNIGVPVTEWALLEDDQTVAVVELSSYMLETMSAKTLDFAALLNISPDHLDRYKTIGAYTETKFRIGNCLKGGELFVHPTLMREQCRPYFVSEMPEPRTFEEENLHAVYSLVRPFGVTAPSFEAAVASYRKPPHRLEFLGEKGGVCFYNDSKGTNVDAVAKAVSALKGPICLIAGGKDKGESYAVWGDLFLEKVKCVSLIGEAAEKIARDLGRSVPVTHCGTLQKAFDHSVEKARPGDCVLLSPGCSSFDQFSSYEERGEEFRRLVDNLSII